MFTGIVQASGESRAIEPRGGDVELRIRRGRPRLENVAIGDSIAVNGCCLTVTRLDGDEFAADVSRETLSVTTLGEWQVGARVNLEKALCAGQPLGGHYVTGHVDGIGDGASLAERCALHAHGVRGAAALARYIARKARSASTA